MKRKHRLVNVQAVRALALEHGRRRYERMPRYMPRRVSEVFIQRAESALAAWIAGEVLRMPSKGVTIK